MENDETTFTTIGQAMTGLKEKLPPQATKSTGQNCSRLNLQEFKTKQIKCNACKDAGWVIANNELRKCPECRPLTIKPNPFGKHSLYNLQLFATTTYTKTITIP